MPHLIRCVEHTADGPRVHVARVTFYSLKGRLAATERYWRRELPNAELSSFEALWIHG